jgi:hypothetical protein
MSLCTDKTNRCLRTCVLHWRHLGAHWPIFGLPTRWRAGWCSSLYILHSKVDLTRRRSVIESRFLVGGFTRDVSACCVRVSSTGVILVLTERATLTWMGQRFCANLVPRCSFRWLQKPLEAAEPNYFSLVQTRSFVYTLRMNILTCAQLKLDDYAEFQIVPTIYNQTWSYCIA